MYELSSQEIDGVSGGDTIGDGLVFVGSSIGFLFAPEGAPLWVAGLSMAGSEWNLLGDLNAQNWPWPTW